MQGNPKPPVIGRHLLLAGLFAVAGCSTLPGGQTPSATLRVVHLTPAASTIWLTAAAFGTLQPVGECVYLVTASGEPRLALWPDTFVLDRVDGRAVGVRNTLSGTRLAFGQPARFGGGNMQASPAALTEPLPASCTGPAMMLYFE